MLEVSAEALENLGNVGGPEHKNTPIRVAVMGSGATNCGLGLMIDQMLETDISFKEGEYTIIVDKNLMEFCKKISLDFAKGDHDRCDSRSKRGFLISADNPVNI